MSSENSFWLEKWLSGQTQFHRDHAHPFLKALFADIPKGTILVPLCGKTRDMLWLREQGHRVIGAELSELACRAFFEENKIPYREKSDGPFVVFEADQITLWCGDFFALRLYATAGVTAVFDRAAMVALPPLRWGSYARHLRYLMGDENSARIPLRLITVEYPSEFLGLGPPFAVTLEDLKKVWKPYYRILPLEHRRDPVFENHPRFKDATVGEVSYRMIPIIPPDLEEPSA